MKQEEKPSAEKRPARKKRKKKNRKWILILAAVILLAAAAVLVLYFVKVKTFEVEGNRQLSDEQVSELFYPEEEDKRLYKVLYNQLSGFRKNEAFDAASVKLSGLQSAVITVKESVPAFVIATDASANYYNSYGVRIPAPEHLEVAYPKLAGIGFIRSDMLKKPVFSSENAAVYEQCCSIFKMTGEVGLPADSLYVQGTQFTLSFRKVRVSLGGYENMLEKLHEITYQYDQYEGLSGVLHMEDFDPDDPYRSYWFSVDTE